MYRIVVIIGKISPDRTNRTPTQSGGVWSILKGLILYIIPVITWQHEKNLHTVCLFTIYLLPLVFIVFFSREIQFAKPMPFQFSLFTAVLSFSFLDRWRQLSRLPRLEIIVFSQNVKVNVKLIHTSGLGVSFFQYEVDYRSADVA